jgi:hypothetical protein
MKAVGLVFTALLSASMLGQAGAADAPDIVVRAVHAREVQPGFIMFERDSRRELKYPGHDDVTDVKSTRIIGGVKVHAAKLRRRIEGDKELSAAELAKLQQQIDKKPASELACIVPASSASLSEFTFEPPKANGDVTSIAFRSTQRDEQHCDGTMTINTAAARIVRIDYVPSVYPQFMTGGSGVMSFAEVLPGTWEMVREEMHYTGKQGPITGTYDLVVSNSRFRRFATLGEAQRAL